MHDKSFARKRVGKGMRWTGSSIINAAKKGSNALIRSHERQRTASSFDKPEADKLLSSLLVTQTTSSTYGTFKKPFGSGRGDVDCFDDC
jgi:hypothetical protein